MKSRFAFAVVLSSCLIPALASAAPRVRSVHHGLAPSAEPQCGGPKTPEGPQPPKEPPKT